MNEKIIVLMSGGLDSTVLFYKLYSEGEDILPVFIDYGQHNAKKEYSTIMSIIPLGFKNSTKVIELKGIYSESKSVLIVEKDLWKDDVSETDMYVPYRNLVIFSSAVAYAQSIGVTKVYAAFINTYYAREIDASVKFLDVLDNLMSDIGGVSIILPFQKMTKLDVLKLGVELNAPVTKTYSCQVNSESPCGACPNCVERLDAFNKL